MTPRPAWGDGWLGFVTAGRVNLAAQRLKRLVLMRATRVFACLAMVGALVAFSVVPASADAPTVSVTPNKKLADGQTVSVTASGFAANTLLAVGSSVRPRRSAPTRAT